MFKKIYVEITNACNLNCDFCIKNKRQTRFMTTEEFSKILKKIQDYTKYLYLHVLGEPLLHPNINEFIDLASKDFQINITTNGYLIERIKDNKNVRQVNISLHSFNDRYNKTLKEYLDNIYDAINRLRNNNTIISLRMWVNSDNKKEILNYFNQKFNSNIDGSRSVKIDTNLYFDVEEEFIWPSLDNDYFSLTGSCRGTRDHIGILVDGTIVPCCLDSLGDINLGNIYSDDVRNVIASDKFQTIKNGFLNNKKICTLCKKCNFYDLRKKD